MHLHLDFLRVNALRFIYLLLDYPKNTVYYQSSVTNYTIRCLKSLPFCLLAYSIRVDAEYTKTYLLLFCFPFLEPDFLHNEALAPFQPLVMKVIILSI